MDNKLRIPLRLRAVLLFAGCFGLPLTLPADEVPAEPSLGDMNCRSLMTLYSELAEAGDEVDDSTRDAVAAAILERPGCGETDGQLQDARPAEGVDPFDERAPGGHEPAPGGEES